jgi:mRNA interferase MazF
MNAIKKGVIYWTEFSPTVGSEQNGLRPALVIQNDIGNQYAPTVIVAIMTKQRKGTLPTHVELGQSKYNGLSGDSVVMLEQIRTVDKLRVGDRIDELDEKDMGKVEEAILTSFGIDVNSLKIIH